MAKYIISATNEDGRTFENVLPHVKPADIATMEKKLARIKHNFELGFGKEVIKVSTKDTLRIQNILGSWIEYKIKEV